MTRKSIWAIVAGVLFVFVATTLVDILLHLVHVFPPMGQPIDDRLSLIATSYRIPIGVLGGWLTARLAPDRPMWHAMRLGFVGLVLGLVGAVATWNAGFGPHWFAIALPALAIPQSWAGGRLYERRSGGG